MVTVHQRPRRHLRIFQTQEQREVFCFFFGVFFFLWEGTATCTTVHQTYGTTQKVEPTWRFEESGHVKWLFEIKGICRDQPWSRFRSWPACVHRGRRFQHWFRSTEKNHGDISHASKWLGSTGYFRHIPQLSPIHKRLPFNLHHDSTLIPDFQLTWMRTCQGRGRSCPRAIHPSAHCRKRACHGHRILVQWATTMFSGEMAGPFKKGPSMVDKVDCKAIKRDNVAWKRCRTSVDVTFPWLTWKRQYFHI